MKNCSVRYADLNLLKRLTISLLAAFSQNILAICPISSPSAINVIISKQRLAYEYGNQIFFNAFYDEVDSNSLFEVNVRFDGANKTMLVKVALYPSLNPTNKPIHYRVKYTCYKLHLLKEYNFFLSSELRLLKTRIKSTYRVTGSKYDPKQDFVNSQVDIWKDLLKSDGFNTPLLRLLYAHLIKNYAFHTDILTLFD